MIQILPLEVQIFLTGATELTNGCIMLHRLSNDGMKFLLTSIMLALGGLCITMQTTSVTAPLRMRNYFSGKILQALISVILSILLLPLLFSAQSNMCIPKEYVILIVFCTALLIHYLRKKSCSISQKYVV